MAGISPLAADSIDALQAGSLALATLSFDAVADGISPSSFRLRGLSDSLGNPLAARAGRPKRRVRPPGADPPLHISDLISAKSLGRAPSPSRLNAAIVLCGEAVPKERLWRLDAVWGPVHSIVFGPNVAGRLRRELEENRT